MSRNEILSQFREQNELNSLGGDFMYKLIQGIGDDLRDWELYADMIKRTAKAQALTAQELDLRNFFQHANILFWIHPVWKIDENQCFYVYDFAFRFINSTNHVPCTSHPPIGSLLSPDPELWLFECSYTTSKPAAAKRFFRKRGPYIDRKFQAAKRRGISTVLLLEALHVPPQDLYHTLPPLDYADLVFTCVVTFKEWVLNGLRKKGVFQDPLPSMPSEKIKASDQTQTQLNGFMSTSDRSSTSPYVTRKRKGRKSQ